MMLEIEKRERGKKSLENPTVVLNKASCEAHEGHEKLQKKEEQIDNNRCSVEQAFVELAASEALNNEKASNTKIEGLTENKIKLISKMNDARDREKRERGKMSLEDPTVVLNKASCEAHEGHEKLQKKEEQIGLFPNQEQAI
ncbi:hypothetical protein EJB05_35638, partial [Eragrostis curvula]